jgi:dTDP-4-dehydrorhamnose 3,5-epimerase
MKVTSLALPEVLLIEPKVFGDERGFFIETYQEARYRDAGIPETFVQDNVSRSSRGVLRGLHLQNPHGQGKLVHVLEGEVFDVAVDVRVGSKTFGRWVSATLSASNHHQLYVPQGFAHGFCVTSERALFCYKCTDLYHPEYEVGIAWDDADLAIEWPDGERIVSERDRAHPRLHELSERSEGRLPHYV